MEAVGREPLPVLVQVNTSGEESKFGAAPGILKFTHLKSVHDSRASVQTV